MAVRSRTHISCFVSCNRGYRKYPTECRPRLTLSWMFVNIARRYIVHGRVQGVGFRWFAQKAASDLGLHGYARNLDDGRVEVYAIGPTAKLDDLNGMLWKGPRMSDVRGVEAMEAQMVNYRDFRIT